MSFLKIDFKNRVSDVNLYSFDTERTWGDCDVTLIKTHLSYYNASMVCEYSFAAQLRHAIRGRGLI